MAEKRKRRTTSMQFESDNEDSISRCSDEENSDSESLDVDEPSSAKQKGNVKQKKGRKSTWQDRQINDLVVICSSQYFKKGLIFTNTKNSKNGEIYEQVLKQVKERYLSQGEEFPFTVSQIRNKFKKCISECKKIALTVKTATGIKQIQDEKNFGVWFTELYELVKTRDSCRPELAIEPSSRASPFSEIEADNINDIESELDAENPSGSDGSHLSAKAKKSLFVPIRKTKTQKKEELTTAVEILHKVVDSNQMKELITFFKEENERAREHELRLMQMFMSTTNSRNTNNMGSNSGSMPSDSTSTMNYNHCPLQYQNSFHALETQPLSYGVTSVTFTPTHSEGAQYQSPNVPTSETFTYQKL